MLRLGIVILTAVFQTSNTNKWNRNQYKDIFQNVCPNRFHETSTYQKPYLIVLYPTQKEFKDEKLCRTAFTVHHVHDNTDILLCFRFIHFTFENCSVRLVISDINESRTYKEQLPPGKEQHCFRGKTAYVSVKSADFASCSTSTEIVVEITAKKVDAYEGLSSGYLVLVVISSLAFAFGAFTVIYNKCIHKRKPSRTPRQTNIEPEENARMTYYLNRFTTPDEHVNTNVRLHYPSPTASITQSRLATPNRPPNSPSGSHSIHSAGSRTDIQESTPFVSHQSRGSRRQIFSDFAIPNPSAPPPSYEACMAAINVTGCRRQTSNDDDTTDRVADITDDVDVPPPPYPGM